LGWFQIDWKLFDNLEEETLVHEVLLPFISVPHLIGICGHQGVEVSIELLHV
jgi:hypothetical protein